MKKAWLIKVSIDNHTYNHCVMICDEKTVKSYCKGKTEESEFDNYDFGGGLSYEFSTVCT